MLAEVDARVAFEGGENQANQAHFLLAGSFVFLSVKEGQRGEEGEECGGGG